MSVKGDIHEMIFFDESVEDGDWCFRKHFWTLKPSVDEALVVGKVGLDENAAEDGVGNDEESRESQLGKTCHIILCIVVL